MYLDKDKVLEDAPGALNNPNKPWSVRVEENKIIATWKWKDGTFFSPNEINDEIKSYSFEVKLKNNGKWSELDRYESRTKNFSIGNGQLQFGSEKFIGNTVHKSFSMQFGTDRNTGNIGVTKTKFDNSLIKNEIREYLTRCGWKKGGLFS